MTGREARTQDCSATEARGRLAKARKFLEVGELVQEVAEDGDEESASISAALFVLAGIAAADAACCHALGRRSRAKDHHAVEGLVAEVVPGGPQTAMALRRLLGLKDEAHYGFYAIGGAQLRAAGRQARAVVDFAAAAMRP
jgi:hypothetical protein